MCLVFTVPMLELRGYRRQRSAYRLQIRWHQRRWRAHLHSPTFTRRESCPLF